ncbi:MAG: hypothetical protein ABEK16_05480 [Candidatus Nanohalobium sp.]
MWVLESEEYSEIRQELEDVLSEENIERNSGRFRDLYDNAQDTYSIIESAAYKWSDSGEFALGSSRQKTSHLMEKADIEGEERSMGRAISMLYELDLIDRHQRATGNRWDLSESNINEIGKYCKVIQEEGEDIIEEKLDRPYQRS